MSCALVRAIILNIVKMALDPEHLRAEMGVIRDDRDEAPCDRAVHRLEVAPAISAPAAALEILVARDGLRGTAMDAKQHRLRMTVQRVSMLSVIIPVYNEGLTLGLVLARVARALPDVRKEIVNLPPARS